MENDNNTQGNDQDQANQEMLSIKIMLWNTQAYIHLTVPDGPSVDNLRQAIHQASYLRAIMIKDFLNIPVIKLLFFSNPLGVETLKKQLRSVAEKTNQSKSQTMIHNINEVIGFKNILIDIFAYLSAYSHKVKERMKEIKNQIKDDKINCQAIIDKLDEIIADREQNQEQKVERILNYFTENISQIKNLDKTIADLKHAIQYHKASEEVISYIGKIVGHSETNSETNSATLLEEFAVPALTTRSFTEDVELMKFQHAYAYSISSEVVNLLIDIGIEPEEILYFPGLVEFVSTTRLHALIASLQANETVAQYWQDSGNTEEDIYTKILANQQDALIEHFPIETMNLNLFIKLLNLAVKFGREQIIEYLFGNFNDLKETVSNTENLYGFTYAILSNFTQAIMRGNENICLQFSKPEILALYPKEVHIALIKLICLRSGAQTGKILINNLMSAGLIDTHMIILALNGLHDRNQDRVAEIIQDYQEVIFESMLVGILGIEHSNEQAGSAVKEETKFAYQWDLFEITKLWSKEAKLAVIKKHIAHIDAFKQFITTKSPDYLKDLLKLWEKENSSQQKISSSFDDEPIIDSKPLTVSKHKGKKKQTKKKVTKKKFIADSEDSSKSDDKSSTEVENENNNDDHKPDDDGEATKAISVSTEPAEETTLEAAIDVEAKTMIQIIAIASEETKKSEPETIKLAEQMTLSAPESESESQTDWISVFHKPVRHKTEKHYKSSTKVEKVDDKGVNSIATPTKTDNIQAKVTWAQVVESSAKTSEQETTQQAAPTTSSESDEVNKKDIGTDIIFGNVPGAVETSTNSNPNEAIDVLDSPLRFGDFEALTEEVTLPVEEETESQAIITSETDEMLPQVPEQAQVATHANNAPILQPTMLQPMMLSFTQTPQSNLFGLQALPVLFSLGYIYADHANQIYSNRCTCQSSWLINPTDGSVTYSLTISNSQSQITNYYYISLMNKCCTINILPADHQLLQLSTVSTASHQIWSPHSNDPNIYMIRELDNFNRPILDYTVDAYDGKLLVVHFGLLYYDSSIILSNATRASSTITSNSNTATNGQPDTGHKKSAKNSKKKTGTQQASASTLSEQDSKTKSIDSLKQDAPKLVGLSVSTKVELSKNLTLTSDAQESKEHKEEVDKNHQARDVVVLKCTSVSNTDVTLSLLREDASRLLDPLLGKHEDLDNNWSQMIAI